MRVKVLAGDGPTFYEVWNTRETPVPIDRSGGEPHEDKLTLAPPRGGTRIRVLDIPPETAEMQAIDPAKAREHFAEIGAAGASTQSGAASRHPYMHRTESVDYGIVLEGEVVLVLDDSETVLRAGEIVVQRGTNHRWENRSGKPARMVFVLVNGEFTEEVRALLPEGLELFGDPMRH